MVVPPYFAEGKFGGGELWCREVARGLVARGHEVRVVTTNLTRHGSAYEPKAPRRGTAWGLPVRRHRVSLLLGLVEKVAGFFPVAPALPLDPSFAWADVVLVSGIEDATSMLGVLGARLRGKPVVVQAHTHMDLVRRMGPDRRLLLAVTEGMHAAYVQLQTEAEAPFWRARVEERRVLPPVGSGAHPLAPEHRHAKAEARRALGLPPDKGIVLFLGRLHWNKGPLRAAAAMEGLRGQDAELCFVGFLEPHPAKLRGAKVQMADFLRDRFAKVPYRVVGDVDEATKHRWLAACDVLVLPSFNESFGIVFLEAWQHGKPVIGWATGGMPAVIRDGEDGFVVGSIPDLRDRIATLLAKPDLAKRLGAAGQAKAAERFTWDHVAARVEANLARVLELERERLAGKDTSEEIREVLA